ncbi:Vitelline membrane outer layer protein 1,Vitelline membrane outer layer protein 1 homolog [Mytilus coruscus]|uniref:Vitelline membrane outer layer protein 1,Vitelline membrane outer layer protein 1 homolog n=1 Tax=Mytilus coruscus TaxID=42192 RepID=A0A6J8EH41_MYTCO|nr:Vitelline membrane outer layer protein 1,Vitelline membrane outer layer protein 1 homolog [Mytilus coruscus]
MPMWSLCAQFCSRVQVCKSINFIAKSKTCQLNGAEPGEAISELHESVGNSFVAASTFPKELAGSCQDHGCQLSEVCIPKATTHSCIPLSVQFSERRTRYPTTDDIETKQTNGISQRSTSDFFPSSTHIPTAERLPTITEKTTNAIGYPTTDDIETKQPNGPTQRSTSDVLQSSTHVSTTEGLPTITEKTTDVIGYPTTDDIESKQPNGPTQRSTSGVLPSSTHVSTTEGLPTIIEKTTDVIGYPTTDDLETKQPQGPSQRSISDVLSSSTHVSTTEGLLPITEKTTDAIETSTLKVNNGFLYGNWGRKEYCALGHFAIGYSMKIEASQGSFRDDTALNAIRLQCGKPHWTGSRDYGNTVIGVEGPWGGWTSSQLCPNGEVMVSFSLQVEQKIIGDKTAANYVRFKCREIGSDTLGTVLGGSGKWGSYGAWSGYCTVGSAICGLKVKMEPEQGIIDDTSLNDVIFYCCKNVL